MHSVISLGDHPFLVNKKLKDAVDPPIGTNDQHIETAKIEANEDYMAVSFLSGLNRHKYGPLMNELHNAFSMVWDKYPKTLTNDYDLEINWKGDTGSATIPPNDGVEFLIEDIGQDRNVYAIDGSVVITRAGRLVDCHIRGINNYANKCPKREESEVQGNKKDEHP